MTDQKRICIGQLASPHGVKGEIKLRLYLEEASQLPAGCCFYDEQGATLEITSFRSGPKNSLLVRLRGVTTPEDAAGYKGQKLYMDREALPDLPEPETYYIEDLKGLRVFVEGQNKLDGGNDLVTEVHNFGAGDVLEVRVHNTTHFVPFRREAIPILCLSEGWIQVNGAFLLRHETEKKKDK